MFVLCNVCFFSVSLFRLFSSVFRFGSVPLPIQVHKLCSFVLYSFTFSTFISQCCFISLILVFPCHCTSDHILANCATWDAKGNNRGKKESNPRKNEHTHKHQIAWKNNHGFHLNQPRFIWRKTTNTTIAHTVAPRKTLWKSFDFSATI